MPHCNVTSPNLINLACSFPLPIGKVFVLHLTLPLYNLLPMQVSYPAQDKLEDENVPPYKDKATLSPYTCRAGQDRKYQWSRVGRIKSPLRSTVWAYKTNCKARRALFYLWCAPPRLFENVLCFNEFITPPLLQSFAVVEQGLRKLCNYIILEHIQSLLLQLLLHIFK